MREEKRVSIGKIILVTVGVTVAVVATLAALYKLFKKYFKVTFDCGNCEDCTAGCFADDFDPLCDEDFAPKCVLDDEDEEADAPEAEEEI